MKGGDEKGHTSLKWPLDSQIQNIRIEIRFVWEPTTFYMAVKAFYEKWRER